MKRAIKKYNPGFLTDQELIDSFCVRVGEFKILLESVRESKGPSNPHSIVIGPRGSGKTTLLLRIAAEIRRDPSLNSAWFPVVFSEETYAVSTCGEFWLACLFNLANQAKEGNDDLGLRRLHEELRAVKDDRFLLDLCLTAVLEYAESLDKRLVIIVENLNTLFDEIDDPDVGWQLRKTLQCEPRILLIASATSRFQEIDGSNRALYDLFQVITLGGLDAESCAILWNRVSGKEIEPRKIRSLQILTGGNPRLLAIVAEFGIRMSFQDLMADLLDLVDTHTEYFRSHIQALAAQERRVYLALSALWMPATSRQIATICRLSTSQCSAFLKRLVNRGAVVYCGGTARRREYYVAERMYNVYYLLRLGRGRNRIVQALIQFMTAFYSGVQLSRLRQRINIEAQHADRGMRPLLKQALRLLQSAARQTTGTKALEIPSISRYAREAATDELVEQAWQLFSEQQLEDAIETCNQIEVLLHGVSSPTASQHVAFALSLKTLVLVDMDRVHEAVGVCDTIFRRFGTSELPDMQSVVAKSLAGKVALLGTLGKIAELVEVSDVFVDRFDASNLQTINLLLSEVLLNKGVALSRLQQPEQAYQIFEGLIERFGHDKTGEFDGPVAMAMVMKGTLLEEKGLLSEALIEYNTVIGRFEDNQDAALSDALAGAFLRKAGTLIGLCQFRSAIECLESVGMIVKSSDPLKMAINLAMAHTNRGVLLEFLGESDHAQNAYDMVIDEFQTHVSPEIDKLRATALANKSISLLRSNRTQEALVSLNTFRSQFGESESPTILHLLSGALLEMAEVALRVGNVISAISTASEVLTKFGTDHPIHLVHAHLIRAEGYFSDGNRVQCETELAAVLEALPNLEMLPAMSIEALMVFAVRFGPRPILDLITGSPAAHRLHPLVTALQQELGLKTKVAIEVEEVAKDIRGDLAELRDSGAR